MTIDLSDLSPEEFENSFEDGMTEAIERGFVEKQENGLVRMLPEGREHALSLLDRYNRKTLPNAPLPDDDEVAAGVVFFYSLALERRSRLQGM